MARRAGIVFLICSIADESTIGDLYISAGFLRINCPSPIIGSISFKSTGNELRAAFIMNIYRSTISFF